MFKLIFRFGILIPLWSICVGVLQAQAQIVTAQEIQTPYGIFPIAFTSLQLPSLTSYRKEIVKPLSLSKLPSLDQIPEPKSSGLFSFFDSEKKLYEDGIKNLFQQNWELAMRRFLKVRKEDPKGKWAFYSLFRIAQIHLLQGQYAKAGKILKGLRGKAPTDTMNFYIYQSLAWIDTKQNKCLETITWIDRANQVTDIAAKEKRYLLYLKLYCAEKLNQTLISEQILQDLQNLAIQSHNDEVYLAYLKVSAEQAFRRKQWQKVTEIIAQNFDNFYNEPQIESLTLMGIWSWIELENWNEAEKWVQKLEKRGLEKRDSLSRVRLELALRQKKIRGAIEMKNTIISSRLRSQALRKILRVAAEQGNDALVNLPWQEEEVRDWKQEFLFLQTYVTQRNGQLQEAVQKYQQLQPTKKLLKEEILYYQILLQLQLGQSQKAVSLIQQFTAQYVASPHLSECYFWSAAYLPLEQKNQFLITLRQIENTSQRNDDQIVLKANFFAALEQWNELLRQTTNFVEEFPTSEFLEDIYLLRANAFFALQQYQQGLAVIIMARQQLGSFRKSQQFAILQAQLWIALQKLEDANELLEMEISKSPSFPLVILRLQVLEQLNLPQDSVLLVEQVMDQVQWKKNRNFIFTIASCKCSLFVRKMVGSDTTV